MARPRRGRSTPPACRAAPRSGPIRCTRAPSRTDWMTRRCWRCGRSSSPARCTTSRPSRPTCAGGEQPIDDTTAYDELVLWYEHDLFDQLNLIQILTRLVARLAEAGDPDLHRLVPRPAAFQRARRADDQRAGAAVRHPPADHLCATDARRERRGRPSVHPIPRRSSNSSRQTPPRCPISPPR